MLCPHCGRENTQEAMYCVGCGASLSGAQTNEPSVGQPMPVVQPMMSQPGQDAVPSGYQQPYEQPGYQQPYDAAGYGQPYAAYGQPGYQVPPTAIPSVAYAVPTGPYPPVNRNIAVCILLSIITCGIYGIYWIYCLVNELNTASGHPQDTSGGMVILFSILTCGIYGIYWYYKAGEKVAEIRRRQTGAADNSSAILYLVLALFGFGIVNDCLIQNELNNLAPLA
ncbi:DUF4234 domain-containing protein [Adlercreutzia sp. ZJ141]|uniref:DUF4234 domain-containing protein n=1 Tax=Adlercreutzia sp. ZJ141 TaxID=2709406 RepID=UPI0013EC2BA1|nr:DUF4234 domain-containing protein [Adlercreutzia sp. ZJ141]